MKYIVHYLYLSKVLGLDNQLGMFKQGFKLLSKLNCTFQSTSYLSDFCHNKVDVIPNQTYPTTQVSNIQSKLIALYHILGFDQLGKTKKSI